MEKRYYESYKERQLEELKSAIMQTLDNATYEELKLVYRFCRNYLSNNSTVTESGQHKPD